MPVEIDEDYKKIILHLAKNAKHLTPEAQVMIVKYMSVRFAPPVIVRGSFVPPK